MTIEELIAKLEERKKELLSNSKECEDINELRHIQSEIESVNEQIENLRQLNINNDSFNAMGTYGVRAEETHGDADLEYRQAFMAHVLENKPIENRQNQNTKTSDVGAVIPTVLIDRIVEKMEETGMILSLVNKTSFSAGVVIPTSAVKPVASWVAEGATSDKQKKTTGKITFSYFKLRCEISMSMEVGTMALAVFEQRFVEQVSKAMIIAIEKAILAGTGSGQPTGILNTATTPKTNVQIAGDTPTYKELCNIEAAVPVEYEGTAKWCMTKAEFMNFMSMTDSNGQPIARVNYGIGGKVERTILGREAVIHPYATEMGTVKAFIYDFNDYILNTIYDMGISKKQDWDTEDLLTKAVMSVDGKPVSAESLITVTKKGG